MVDTPQKELANRFKISDRTIKRLIKIKIKRITRIYQEKSVNMLLKC